MLLNQPQQTHEQVIPIEHLLQNASIIFDKLLIAQIIEKLYTDEVEHDRVMLDCAFKAIEPFRHFFTHIAKQDLKLSIDFKEAFIELFAGSLKSADSYEKLKNYIFSQ